MTKVEVIKAISVLLEIVNAKSYKHLDDNIRDEAVTKIENLIKLL